MGFFISMASPQRSLPRMREKPVRMTGPLMTDSPFILARGEISQCGMATTRIVPPLEPREDLAASLLACREVISIQHLSLETGKEGFHHCVVEAIADAAHRTGDSELETAIREGHSRIFGAVAHPTTYRENTSRIAARYSQPSSVGMYVTSANHKAFARVAVKCRWTRSGAYCSGFPGRVVQRKRRFCTPCKPARRISRATRLRPTRTPCSKRNSMWILGAP